MIIRRCFSRVFRWPEPGDEGTGPDTTTPQVDTAPVVETPPAPANLGEAMFPKAAETPEQAEARARDERGRFAAKGAPDPNAPPVDPTKPAVDPLKPVDPLAPPAGLSPAANVRFQELANTNKELTAKVTELQPVIEQFQGFQSVLHENGVTREQFDQAAQVIGLMNRRDFAGAQAVLEEQLRQISLVTGKPIGQVDALSKFPDLRNAVDNLQITEEHAMEIAKGRAAQFAGQQQHQRQQQEAAQQRQVQEQAQQEQRATQEGQLAVDKFCRAKMSTDLDYAKVEPILLKEVQDGLLTGIPAARWPAIVEKTYNMIRQSVGMGRQQTTVQTLRPSGVDQGQSRPTSMHAAMWK